MLSTLHKLAFLIFIFALILPCTLSGTAATNTRPEYHLQSPVGWHPLQNDRFQAAWIQKQNDPLSPQIYFSINRNLPELNDERFQALIKELKEAVAQSPDGRLVSSSKNEIAGNLKIEFAITYSVYQQKKKIEMGKEILAFFSRGDQFMFMTLYRQQDKRTALETFKRVTDSFHLTGAPPRKKRRPNIIARTLSALKRYWLILIPIALFSIFVIWRDRKKKQVD